MTFTFRIFFVRRRGEDCELDEDEEDSLDEPELLSELEEESLCRFGTRFLVDEPPPPLCRRTGFASGLRFRIIKGL